MLYLKEANLEDWKKEYEAIKQIPQNENGFENKYYDKTEEEFREQVIPELIEHSKGIGLPNGYVPNTYYFLWDADKIVGLFKIRHYLNEFLANGPGHIGYSILTDFRKKGYATILINKLIEIIKNVYDVEKVRVEILKDNIASITLIENNNFDFLNFDDEKITYEKKLKI